MALFGWLLSSLQATTHRKYLVRTFSMCCNIHGDYSKDNKNSIRTMLERDSS